MGRVTHFIDFLLIPVIYFLVISSAVNGQLKSPCNHNEFRCADDTGCLPTEKICNGIEDCKNGEDEKGNSQWDCTRSTLQTECSLAELKCRFGGCIPKEKKCDGIPDCWGGNDEATDLCSPSARPVRKRTQTITIIRQAGTVAPAPIPTEVISTAPPPPPVVPTVVHYEDQTIATPPAWFWQPQIPVSPNFPSMSESSTATNSMTEGANESSEAFHSLIPTSGRQRGCPPLPAEAGVQVRCYSAKFGKIFNCNKMRSPIGTEATYTCAKYWAGPRTGPKFTTRVCGEDGQWSKRNSNWRCSLKCGIQSYRPLSLIVAGRTAAPNEWPWHVALYYEEPAGSGKFQYFCGGTLVSRRAVLTAAHCATQPRTSQKRSDKVIAVPGKYHRSFDKNDDNDKFAQQRFVVDIDINEYYNHINYEADIAIMWLNEDVDITDGVRPCCLPSKHEDVQPGLEEEYRGVLAGWGRTDGREFPEKLQEVDLPVIDIQTCKRAHPSLAMLVRSSTFCAGYRNGTTACDGDSGGGLIFEHPTERGKWFVKGVVSAGIQQRGGGCNEHYYTVFTKVPHYREWIDSLLSLKNYS